MENNSQLTTDMAIDHGSQSAVLTWLEHRQQALELNRMDVHLARFVEDTAAQIASSAANQVETQLLTVLAALVSKNVLQQHTCISLKDAELTLRKFANLPLLLPAQTDWSRLLLQSPLVETDQQAIATGGSAPFVVYNDKFYMQRYFQYEYKAAQFIANKLQPLKVNPLNRQTIWYQQLDGQNITEVVQPLFANETNTNNEINWQQNAVINSVNSGFSVISGGPGTGKTTTVIKLLLTLQRLKSRLSDGQKPLTIKLVAPTGKASQRLSESIAKSKKALAITAEEQNLIPEQALTIHRLLRPKGKNAFLHDRNNPLILDVLILDEASMVDISLMNSLLDAMPTNAQLILLGDQQQLASVEAGNVLADLCAAQGQLAQKSTSDNQSARFQLELVKSYRFDEHSAIGQLAQAVKQGDGRTVLSRLQQVQKVGELDVSQQPSEQAITWYTPEFNQLPVLIEMAVSHYLRLYDIIHSQNEISSPLLAQLFACLAKFQLLACVKQSAWGVDELNQQVQYRLARRLKQGFMSNHYPGRPIMITENAYHLGLYNGDIGIELFDEKTQQLMAYFESSNNDGAATEQLDGYKAYACQRLPAHQTCYVMTVHKSQGSEFEHAALVLPEAHNLMVNISRELIYTGLTRAKRQFSIYASSQAISRSIQQQTKRSSGLAHMLVEQMT